MCFLISPKDNDKVDLSFLPIEFSVSGNGAWHSTLMLNPDGTFSGEYSDWNSSGRSVLCEFSGKFENIKKNNEYSYSLTLKSFKSKYKDGEEFIKDGIEYVTVDSLEDMTVGNHFLLYVPNTPIEQLDEGVLIDWPYRYEEPKENTLTCYTLHNPDSNRSYFSQQIFDVDKTSAFYSYTELMNDFHKQNTDFYYTTKDIDGNGIEELIIQNNTQITVYTYEDNTVKQLDSYDFVTGTFRLFSSQNEAYPGIFYYTVGGGCDHYSYLTLSGENICTTKLCEYYYSADEPYWENISDDKELIAEAKELYNKNKDIEFIKFEPVDLTKNTINFTNNSTEYTATVLFSDANLALTNLVIQNTKTGEEVQNIPINPSEILTSCDQNIYSVDVNFDGYYDLLVPDMRPARGIFFSAYVYDTAKQKFVEAPSFKELPNPAFDTKNQYLLHSSSGDRIMSFGVSYFDKSKNDFVSVSDIVIEPTTYDEQYHFIEYSYQDDKENIKNEFYYPLVNHYEIPKSNADLAPYFIDDSFWDLDSDKWGKLVTDKNNVFSLDTTPSDNPLSLDEVKNIFEPLLKKAIEVEQTITNDLGNFKLNEEFAFRTDDGSDYSLITDDEFDDIDDVWYYAYTAFTDAAASRAFDKYLAQYEVSPRFLLRNGKLYYKVNGHGYKSDFDIDSLKIVNQFNNTIIVAIDNYSSDENTPDKCIFILQNTENGWRFANTEEESYTINADDFMAQVIASHTSQQPAINAFIDFLNAKTTAKNLTPNQPELARNNIFITDLNRRDLSLAGVDQYTFFDLNGDNIPELITEGYEIDVFSYNGDGNINWIYSSPAGSSAQKSLLSNKKIFWSLTSTGVSYEIASFDKDLTVTIDTYFDGATEAEDDDELYLHNGKELTAKEFYKLKAEFFAPHFFETPDTIWYSYDSSNNTSNISRNIGAMQPETQEIITIDGESYQSYVASNVDIRYVLVSRKEYNMSAEWDWVPIGTKDFYSLLLLGNVNEGRK